MIAGGTNTWKYFVTGAAPSVNGTTYTLSVWVKNQGIAPMKISGNIVDGPTIAPGATQQVSFTEVGNGASAVQLGFVTQNVSDSLDVLAFAPSITASGSSTNLIPGANQDFAGWTTYLGSSVTVTPQASVAESLDYLPFGEINSTDSGLSTHKFTGDEHDAETSLDHTQFRQYTSSLGRWLSPDPAGLLVADPSNPQSWNRYSYVLNNPMNFIDPSGLGPQDCFEDPNSPDCSNPCSWPSAACDGGGGGIPIPIGGGGGGGGRGGGNPPQSGSQAPPLTGETNGIPNGLPIPGQTLWQILGLPAQQNPFIFDLHQDANGIWVGDSNGELLCITALPGGACTYLFWDLKTRTWSDKNPLEDPATALAQAVNNTGVQSLANPCFVPGFYLTSAGAAVLISATPAGASLFPATNTAIRYAYARYTLQNAPVRRLIRSMVSSAAYVTHRANQACGSIQ